MKFTEQLKKLRLKKQLTQAELANLVGVSPSAMAMYERGEREPGIKILIIISRVLNVDFATLLGIEKNENSPEQLSEGEKAIIDIFRLIPEEQQKHFLEMGRVFADSLKKD